MDRLITPIKKVAITFSMAVIAVSIFARPSSAFVLLSGPDEARLPVTPESPEITFVYQNQAPTIKDKDHFEDGRYSGMSDTQLFPIILQLAMDQWNNVKGNYLRLKLGTADDGAQFNSDDRIYSIVFGEQGASSAALAFPTVENGKIVDCDIKVSTRSVQARSLAYTILHELGHCIGLGHYHTNYGAVMGYSRMSRSLKLGADDMAGEIYLYPDPAVGNATPQELVSCGALSRSYGGSGTGWLAVLLLLPLIAVVLFRSQGPRRPGERRPRDLDV